MSLFQEYFYYLIDVVLVEWFGWLPFLVALVYMYGWLGRDKRRNQIAAELEWIFLEVKIDNLNEKSPLAMEQIFAAMHAIHQNFTWGEDRAGKTVLYMACEIVSIGGPVLFLFQIPQHHPNPLDTSLF